MRPAVVSIFQDDKIQNAPMIHKAALLYIFFNSLKGL